jgi:hypothetical protein
VRSERLIFFPRVRAASYPPCRSRRILLPRAPQRSQASRLRPRGGGVRPPHRPASVILRTYSPSLRLIRHNHSRALEPRGTVMSLAVNSLLAPPTCTCEACSASMTHLADLSPIGLREAVRVFRCSGCNRVTSAEIGSPILLRKRAVAKHKCALSREVFH